MERKVRIMKKSYTVFRWWGIPFLNRIYNITLNGKPISEVPDLIHIAMPLTAANFMLKMPKLTYGLIKAELFDKYGNSIEKPFVTNFKEYLLFARCVSKFKIKT